MEVPYGEHRTLRIRFFKKDKNHPKNHWQYSKYTVECLTFRLPESLYIDAPSDMNFVYSWYMIRDTNLATFKGRFEGSNPGSREGVRGEWDSGARSKGTPPRTPRSESYPTFLTD